MKSSSINQLADKFRDLIAEGEQAVSEMNQSFLKSSQFIETAVESSAIMNAEAKEIIQMVNWSDGSEDDFNKLAADIRSSLAECLQLIRTLQDNSKSVIGAHSRVESFIHLQNRLMQTLQPLKTMKTFFLIAISKLKSDRQHSMLDVVSNIEFLHKQATEVLSKEISEMRTLQRSLFSEKSKIEVLINDLSNEIDAKNKLIQTSLEGMQQDLRKNQYINVEVERITQAIASTVSESVSAIQSDDITSQKVGHVFEAMEIIHKRMMDWERSSYSVEDHETGLYLISAVRVQKRQIESAIRDCRKSSEDMFRIYPAISEELKLLDDECLALKEYNTFTTSANGAIQILLEALQSIENLFASYDLALSSIKGLIKPLEKISSESADAIDDITIDLRVVTVNARIMADKVGANSGLTPLTENVGQISLESKKCSNELWKELHTFIDTFEGLFEVFQKIELDLHSAKKEFDVLNTEGKERLHAFRDKAFVHLKKLTKNAELIENKVLRQSDARESLKYINYFESLVQLMEEVEDLVIDHYNGQLNLDEMDANLLLDLQGNYTMHSERKNHELAFENENDDSALSTGAKDDEFILF
ncbi:MAG: hypothetical protein MI748_13130 [Opitutales bacterium]|nr:hypothetical protein [Opitutales bacterium]